MFEKDMKISFLLDFYGEVLSERKRTVLDYYYNDDLSLSEIAEDYGMKENAVAMLMFRTRQKLKDFLRKEGFER